MARQRILYSSKLVKIGTATKVEGVQSATYGFELNRTDVNAFGRLAAYDRLLTQTPSVNTELQVLAGQVALMGVVTKAVIMRANTGADLDISIGLDDVHAGGDNGSYTGGNGSVVKTMGNFVGSASAEASVGAFALINLSFEGSGMNVSDTNLGAAPTTCPAVTQEHVAATFNVHQLQGTVQSANMNTNISREIIEKFGERYSATRLLQFPSTASLTMEGLDTKNDVDYALISTYSTLTASVLVSPAFSIKFGVTNAGTGGTAKGFGLIGATTDSVSFNGGIGDNHTLSATFVASIGDTTDTVHNFKWYGV